MKILVVSDTHGRDAAFEKVIHRESPFEALIHCGDVEEREDYYEALLDVPYYQVAGNCDLWSDLPGEAVASICGVRVFITHGHAYNVSYGEEIVAEAAVSRDCRVVCYGHTHRPSVDQYAGVITINPGSLEFPRQPNHKPSYAVLDITKDGRISAEIRYL